MKFVSFLEHFPQKGIDENDTLKKQFPIGQLSVETLQ